VKTLPPPPVHPDVVDQERVVEDALQKADDAKKLQEEKERQHQADLDAQAAKQQKQKQIDDMLAKLDQASAQTQKLDSKAKQAKQQLGGSGQRQRPEPGEPAQGRSAADRQQQSDQRSQQRVRGGHSECGHAELVASG
jgi:hypothetical protein